MTKILASTFFLLLVCGGAFWWWSSVKTNQLTPQATTDERIKVVSPKAGQSITSPLEIKGEARGNWFFEASFPVMLTNWDGLIIAEGVAQAEGEWMTEEFVPFKAMLEFTKPEYGERGTLILKRDNPSGLPEHDAAVEIPVVFK